MICDPVQAPTALTHWTGNIFSEERKDWALLPTRPDWAKVFHGDRTPGEEGAHEKLSDFLEDRIAAYKGLFPYALINFPRLRQCI